MKTVQYVGRAAPTPHHINHDLLDDATSGHDVLTAVATADVVAIDDPMSFPWELVEQAPPALLVVDIGACSPDQRLALLPALIHLRRQDAIIDHTTPSTAADSFATLLDVRSTRPSQEEVVELKAAKALDIVEAAIVRRLESEWSATVTDYDDLPTIRWPSEPTYDAKDGRPTAAIIRLPGATITAHRGGIHALATELVESVDGTRVVDVWGVRANPGDPLARGIVVIEIAK